MWKSSSFLLRLPEYGAAGPVNMLGHLPVCLGRWSTYGPIADEPLDLQRNSMMGLRAIHVQLNTAFGLKC